MKRSLTVLLGALLLWPVFSNVAMNRLAPDDPQAADLIQTIRKQYAAINKGARRYRKVKKELSGFSLEGGELFAYFDGPAIVKIFANHFGESGRASEEYYYRNGKLMFVFRKDYRYDRPMSGKVVATQENRFYSKTIGLSDGLTKTESRLALQPKSLSRNRMNTWNLQASFSPARVLRTQPSKLEPGGSLKTRACC